MRLKLLTTIFAALALFCAAPASAADWQLSAQTVEGQPDLVSFHLSLNAGDDLFNVVEATITLEGNGVRVLETAIGNSIASFWTQRPTLDGNQVQFSFMTPGGVGGDGLPVLSVIASVPPSSSVSVTTHDSAIYRHDGEGTKVVVPDAVLTYDNVSTKEKVAETIIDTRAPEPFTPLITDEPLISTEPTIVFQTQDKQSGIDHYEFYASSVALTDEQLSQIDNWTRIESPYSLPEHIVARHVYIKAVDKGGNVRIAHLEFPRSRSWHWPLITAIFVLTLLAAFIALSKRSKSAPRRKRKNLRKH